MRRDKLKLTNFVLLAGGSFFLITFSVRFTCKDTRTRNQEHSFSESNVARIFIAFARILLKLLSRKMRIARFPAIEHLQ